MASATLTTYEQIPETKENLDWAELVTLDLSQWEKPGGKKKLAQQLTYAVQHVGFFYVQNFGISQEEVDKQYWLAREFYNLPLEEKLKYHSREALERGENDGYRPAGLKESGGVKDNIQVYNIPRFNGFNDRAHPKILQDHIGEIEKFSRDVHEKVILKILRILAVVLELPDEDQLARTHVYEQKGEDQFRYMHYGKRSVEENEKAGALFVHGHTDLGSLTLLFRQPVAALQILNSEDQWKWVKPQAETITVNICDCLTVLTGGYLKSSIHRVHAPPKDQAHFDRIGVFYFARPNNHIVLDPIANSPVLNRLGFNKENDITAVGKRLTVEEWVKLRQVQQQRRAPVDVEKEANEKDYEIVPGLTAKIYK